MQDFRPVLRSILRGLENQIHDFMKGGDMP